VEHPALECEIAEAGIVPLKPDVSVKADGVKGLEDWIPWDQSSSRDATIVLACMKRIES
jgi:hypothetical protein